MLVSTYLFLTADAADNTYTRRQVRFYVFSWMFVVFVIAILGCQVVLSNIKKSKTVRTRLDKLTRKTTSVSGSDRGSHKTGQSDPRSDKTGRSDPRSDKTGRSDPRSEKSGRADNRADKTTSYQRHTTKGSRADSKKSPEKRSSRKEKGSSTRSRSSGEKRSQRSR